MSLGWSDDGPPLDLGRALGWSDDGPVDPDPDPVLGWTPEHWRSATLTGGGIVAARGHARNHGAALLTGAGLVEAAGYPENYADATLTGAGLVAAAGWPRTYDDSDFAGGGLIVATGAIAARGPQIQSGAGTWARPWWARYLDYVLLGAGGGGAGGNQVLADGKSGTPGTWIFGTIDLGATWLAGNIVLALGSGGTAGTRNNNGPGGTGGATTLTSPFGNRSAAGGPGGSGTNPVGGTTYRGLGPGDLTAHGLLFTGGPTVEKNTDGGTPGGGGGGGAGTGFPLNAQPGRIGGPGYAWIRFRQN